MGPIAYNASGIYRATLLWSPDVVGSHSIKVEVWKDGPTQLNNETIPLTISPCPDNLEINALGAVYGQSANVTFAFSRPGQYSPNDTEWFSNFNLAPGFSYQGTEYRIDEPINAVTVRLYGNWTDRYLRSSQIYINNLTAFTLDTTQGTIDTINSLWTQSSSSATWGIQVWIRHSDGTNTSLTSSPVAKVTRSGVGQGLQNSTWSCSNRALSASDSIVVRWYAGAGLNPSLWTLLATSTTENLGATQLNASIWRVVYYTEIDYSETHYHKYDYSLVWGSNLSNTRIINFTSSPSATFYKDLVLHTTNGAATAKYTVDLANYQRRGYNFTLTVLDPLFESKSVTRVIDFTRIEVNAGTGNNLLDLGISLNVANQSHPQIYVGVNSTISASVNLSNFPVYNANASITYAKFVSTETSQPWIKTAIGIQSSAQIVYVPYGSNFLRVASIYDNSHLDGDVNYDLVKSNDWSISADGAVNASDVDLVNANLGRNFLNAPLADPRADINHDGIVDWTDWAIVNALRGAHGNYLPSFGVVAVFSPGGNRSLDSAGCVSIPGGASTVSLWKNGEQVGGFFEFFNAIAEDKSLRTDASGIARASWTPNEVCDYLLEIKLSPSFNATVSQYLDVTGISEAVSLVKYVEVVKRPVTLSLTPITPVNEGDMYSMDIFPSADASISEWSPNDHFGSASVLPVCAARGSGGPLYQSFANYQGWTFINFNMYPRLKDAYIHKAILTLTVEENNDQSDYRSMRDYPIYGVRFPWSETGITWNNVPTLRSDGNPTYEDILNFNRNYTLFSETSVDLTTLQSGDTVSWNLTNQFQSMTFNGSAAFVYGFMIMDGNPDSNSVTYRPWISFWSNNQNNAALAPDLYLEFTLPRTVEVDANDPVLNKPAHVQFDGYVNGTFQEGGLWAGQTLPLGENIWSNSTVGVFNVTAYSSETAEYATSNGSWLYDNRWFTSFTSLQGDTVSVDAYRPATLSFHLNSSELYGVNISYESVSFYVNDKKDDGTYVTNSNGFVNFGFIPAKGTYVVTANFSGTRVFSSSGVSIVVTADIVLPVAIDLSGSTMQVAPGTSFSLSANVTDLVHHWPMYGFLVDFRRVSSAGGNVSIGQVNTDDGVATLTNVQYPNDGNAYAFYATPNDTEYQMLATSPLQLTAGLGTTLLLSVSRQSTSTAHTFMARLVNSSNRAGIRDKLLTLQLNQTDKRTATTDQNGNATWTISLSPQTDNTATVYNIIVSFGGDQNKTVTAYLYNPYGIRYAASTTTQYVSYKPSLNSTNIILAPQTTTGETTLKSTEQMQKEAESEGSFSTWFEFSWWYPWIRIHVKMQMNPTIQVAFNPLLPGGETADWSGLDFFRDLNGQFVEELVLDTIGIFIEYIIAKGFSLWNWPATVIAFIVKGALQSVLLWKDWSNSGRILAAAIASFLIGLIAIRTSLAKAFLDAFFGMVAGATMSSLYLMFNKVVTVVEPVQHFRTWADWTEIGMDMLFGIAALTRYLTLTQGI